MKPVNTKPYHHGNLPVELVRVGLELAQEGGVAAIKLREVARRAGVSPAAAYRHFSGQEDLINAVKAASLEQLTLAMASKVNSLPPRATPHDRICGAAQGYFDFAVNSNQLYPALMETVNTVPHMDDSVRAKVPVDFAAVEERFPADRFPFTYILKLLSETTVAPTELVDVTLVLWSTVHGLSLLCSTGALRDVSPAHKQKLYEMAMNSIFAGLEI